MPTALERLSELVRQAESTARTQKITTEIADSAERLRAAEERTRRAEQRAREVRPVRWRELEQLDAEELQLKELTKKAAQFKTFLGTGDEAEQLIVTAQADLEARRRAAQAELDSVTGEADQARQELRAALDQYQQLRAELDRLQPQLERDFAAADRLVTDAQLYFPGGQLESLTREVEDGEKHFGLLDQKEQYAQLKIWIGRYRRLQAALTEEEQAQAKGLFRSLVELSKEYQPGYIEAFQQNFTTDWDAFIAAAQDQLQQATDAASRRRDLERQQAEQQARDAERQRLARESALAAMDELKALIVRVNLPLEGAEDFRRVLSQVVSGYGASDEELLELIMPFRDLIDTWSEFRALRRNLDRIRQEEAKDEELLQEQFEDLVAATQGRKVLMIGGVAREDVRRTLERVFDFQQLDWETYEDTRPAVLESLEQRVRNRGVDLVLILKGFIRHHVPEKLRPLCEQYSIPCLMVEHGYGPAQIADTLRRGLLKSV